MSRKGNCWDNAPQESFFGHMKDEIEVSECSRYREVKKVIDDWMSYYNNERYQWQLAKLSPNEYYNYITTGIYPLRGVRKEPGRKEGSQGKAWSKEESKDDKTQGETGEEI